MGNLVGALLFGSLAVSGLAHALTGTLLLVIALLSGMSSTVVSPALSAAVRTVVPGSQRAQASAYASGRADAVSLIAPPAGGALIPLGYGISFLADAVSYVVAATSVLLVRHPLTAPERARRPFWLEMGEGFAFLGRHTTLMAFLVRSATFNLGVSTVTTATVLRLADRGVPTAQIGVVDTIAAVGGLLGALFALTALSGSPWVVGAFFAAGMVLMPMNSSGVIGYFSHVVPNGFQGRFFGASGLVYGALLPLGPFLAGMVRADWGGGAAVWLGSALIALSCLPILLVRELRTLPTPDEWSTWAEIEDAG